MKDPHAGKITGIIDMFDILTALLRLFKETKDIATPQGVQHWTHWINDLGQMIQRGESLSHAYVYMHLRPHPPPVVSAQAFLPAVMQHFHSGHHRVLVANEAGEITAVLSQSQVLRFLAANIHLVDAKTAQVRTFPRFILCSDNARKPDSWCR